MRRAAPNFTKGSSYEAHCLRIGVWDVLCRPVERGLVHGILGRVQALHILFMVSRCDVVVVGFRTPESFGHLNAARRLAISPEID